MTAYERTRRLASHVKPCICSEKGSIVEPPSTTQFISAKEAVSKIPTGATIALAGFVGCSCPEAIIDALRSRFDESSTPRECTLVWGISSGDKKTRGYGKLAVEGLVKKCIYAWTASAPQFLPLIKENKIEVSSS